MDLKKIKSIINMVEDAKISALALEQDGFKIEIKKEFIPAHQSFSIQQPTMHYQQAPLQEQPVVKVEPVEPVQDKNVVVIKSPMVGTFYTSSNPETPAYVKVGDSVKEGQVVCIIEAMKIFNEIESEFSGIIEKVCVENSTPVEYGQELFLIRKV
ncbi:MAG: acetyl-CoA carboxylase biotin carboxyl carrier protein [Candidatus Margulisiibacteriota bacterium]